MTSRKPAHLLLVDDDPGLLKLLGMRLVSEGYSVVTAESGLEGLKILSREKIDLVISDLRMDEMDGLQLFAEIQKQQPGMPVIILTAHGSIPDAVAATQQGVFSFLTKPVDKDALYKAIDSALEHAAPAGDEAWREPIVTRSPVMLRLLEQARMVAQSDVSVLINGQSGTGKEILAQAIHNASPRSKNAFIAINCGALPEQLLESELFGHARGAFTGAVSSREGLFQAAEGGTLFLDEIGDMPAPLQVKLLRVLQERTFERVGSNKTQNVDVRIIAATHKNLEKMIEDGTFREDLYYRLNVFPIEMAPLRERVEDIALLLNELISRMEHEKRGSIRFNSAAIMSLCRHDWPGNVRELANLVERLAIMHPYGVIGVGELPKKFRHVDDEDEQLASSLREELEERAAINAGLPGMDAPAMLPAEGLDLKDYLANLEQGLIQQALDDAGGVVARAAERLRIRRTTLVEKMRKYGMSRRDDDLSDD